LLAAVTGIVLIPAVFAAVHHAEIVAHRIGEPFGTFVLALAVTVIETALIVSVMLAAPAENAALPRDTIFAVVMIVCSGIVGGCLLWGGMRHHEQTFQLQAASAELALFRRSRPWQPLELGLDPKEEVLLILTLLVSVITLGTGRTTVLEGAVHLLIFAVFLFFAVTPSRLFAADSIAAGARVRFLPNCGNARSKSRRCG
jgi:Ca2+/H+ antiporter